MNSLEGGEGYHDQPEHELEAFDLCVLETDALYELDWSELDDLSFPAYFWLRQTWGPEPERMETTKKEFELAHWPESRVKTDALCGGPV